MRSTMYYLLLIILQTALFWGFISVIDNIDSEQLTPISTVDWTISSASSPDNITEPWQQTQLPKVISVRDSHSHLWFRLPANAYTCGPLQAVFIPKQMWGIKAFMNDRLVFESFHSSFTAPNWHAPLILSLPEQDCMQPVSVYLQMQQGNRTMLLSPFFIGAPERIVPSYQTYQLLNITIPQITCVILWMFLLLMLIFWWQRKRDSVYGWFALVVAMWAGHSTLRLMALPTFMPAWLWTFLLTACVAWFVSLGVVFVHRFIKVKNLPLELTLNGINSVMSVTVMYLAYQESTYYSLVAGIIWIGSILLVGVYIFFRLAFSRTLLTMERVWLCGSSLMILTVGIHDYTIVSFSENKANQYYLHHSGFIFIFVFLLLLAFRYQRILQYQYHIKRRIKHRLVKNVQRYRKNQSKVLIDERKRIMQNLHDGVGGHLISAINSLRLGNADPKLLVEILQQSIDDLRIIIDSLDADMNDLSMFLIFFRERYEPRLNACGIHLLWSNEVSPGYRLDANKALNTLRILQECFTNIIKHSHASEVSFSVIIDSTDVHCPQACISISDNGRGIAGHSSGRGINNLHTRAEKLQGSLHISSSASGAHTQLVFPLSDIISTK